MLIFTKFKNINEKYLDNRFFYLTLHYKMSFLAEIIVSQILFLSIVCNQKTTNAQVHRFTTRLNLAG